MPTIKDKRVLEIARKLDIIDAEDNNNIDEKDIDRKDATTLNFYPPPPPEDTRIEDSVIEKQIDNPEFIKSVSVISQPDGGIVTVTFEDSVTPYIN